jgi:Ni/Co efflux regulator RcnB
MHMRKILPALVGLSLGASGAVYAQGNPRPQDEPGFRPYAGAPPQNLPPQQRGGQRDQRGQRNDYRGNDNRGNDYRGARNDYRGHDGRGAGPEHSWYRGGRLPSEYRGRQYVVDDWRGHHLSAPPRGYHWVQAGGDYVLAAIATGVIASILLNQ